MKTAILTTILMLPFFTHANLSPQYSYQQEELLMDEITDLINYLEMQEETSYQVAGTTVNDRCTAFIDSKLQLGTVGKSISTELQKNEAYYKPLLDSASMKRDCPLYDQLTLENKAMVWTTLLVVMAHYESSCNTAVEAQGTNGTASGYFQLHKNREHVYDGQAKTCERGSSTDGAKSARCALGMLKQQLEKHGEIYSSKSYWEVLRPRGRSRKAWRIQNTIKRISLCTPAPVV